MWQISSAIPRQQLQISISLLKNESDTNEKEIIRQNWVRYGSFTWQGSSSSSATTLVVALVHINEGTIWHQTLPGIAQDR